MKKVMASLILTVSSLSFAATEDYCVSFEIPREYSTTTHNMFCGLQGETAFSKAAHLGLSEQPPYVDWIGGDEVKEQLEAVKRDRGLVYLDDIKVNGTVAYEIFSPRSESAPAESIAVITRTRATIGFNKKRIGYKHVILSSNGIRTEIIDDLNNTILSDYLSRNGFELIVNPGKQKFRTYSFYIKR